MPHALVMYCIALTVILQVSKCSFFQRGRHRLPTRCAFQCFSKPTSLSDKLANATVHVSAGPTATHLSARNRCALVHNMSLLLQQSELALLGLSQKTNKLREHNAALKGPAYFTKKKKKKRLTWSWGRHPILLPFNQEPGRASPTRFTLRTGEGVHKSWPFRFSPDDKWPHLNRPLSRLGNLQSAVSFCL